EDVRRVAGKGHFLYSVKAFTHKDMKDKDRTPLDYIKEIEKMGFLLGSYSDIDSINGLNDNEIHNQDIAFIFLFSSVLEPDLIAVGLQVDEEQITPIELPKAVAEDKVNSSNVAKASKNVIEKSKKGNDKKSQKKSKKKENSNENLKSKKTAKKVDKKPDKKKKKSSSKNETLRVHVSLLNDLMTLAGEMVLARNQLLRMTSEVVKSVPGLQTVTQDINNTTTMLQGKIMDTRMQAISLVFNKFPRVIRDMAKMLDKKINLETVGNSVDLDKSIIENLSDPLTHLVRNAADHGLESTEERLAAGKPETGTVFLKAYHESGKVNIDVIDDGKGIDPEIIANKAIEKGLVSEQDIKKMPEKEILALIFAPGFSTADAITKVSGRGVGMDVVKTNIEKLGGTVSINSKIGEGTSINLKLPLTLAIIPSLIVTVNDLQFALPQVALKELVRIKKGDDKRKIEQVNDAPVLRLRNQLLPLVYLNDVLKLKRDKEQSEITRILVLKNNEYEFGLVVDEISNSEEIVVKSIPRFFNKSLCYSGTTIMGDGSVSLILDVNGISAQSGLNFTALQTYSTSKEIEEKDDVGENTQDLLLFQNTDSEMFALNLDLIKRIEKVKISEIDYVGENAYIEHEGESLPILKLEHYLPVASPEVNENQQFVYVIIPTQIENPIGIIAHQIIDSIKLDVKIDTEHINSKG
ncbi:MAG: chemotaxis protein CheA, partial [Candidatus Cloacimonadota bacterium]|nr:chemotaxis protein CheA [Candidatus Cloacimonadota bacterium]